MLSEVSSLTDPQDYASRLGGSATGSRVYRIDPFMEEGAGSSQNSSGYSSEISFDNGERRDRDREFEGFSEQYPPISSSSSVSSGSSISDGGRSIVTESDWKEWQMK